MQEGRRPNGCRLQWEKRSGAYPAARKISNADNGLLGSFERVLIFWLGMKAVIEQSDDARGHCRLHRLNRQAGVTNLIDNPVISYFCGCWGSTQVDRLSDIVLTSTERHDKARQPVRAGALTCSIIECVNLCFRYNKFEPLLLDLNSI